MVSSLSFFCAVISRHILSFHFDKFTIFLTRHFSSILSMTSSRHWILKHETGQKTNTGRHVSISRERPRCLSSSLDFLSMDERRQPSLCATTYRFADSFFITPLLPLASRPPSETAFTVLLISQPLMLRDIFCFLCYITPLPPPSRRQLSLIDFPGAAEHLRRAAADADTAAIDRHSATHDYFHWVSFSSIATADGDFAHWLLRRHVATIDMPLMI